MRDLERRGWNVRHRIASAIACALAAGAASTAAALTVTGGPKKAACYAVFDTQGGTQNKRNRVECTDCDPTCDMKNAGQADRECDFMVRACVNDPTVNPGVCTAHSIKKLKISQNLLPAPTGIPGIDTSACGAFADVPVKIKVRKHGKKLLDGSKVIRLMVRTTGKGPKTGTATLMLVCHPRTGECPTTTSTTTTTTTSTTTTTLFVSCAAAGLTPSTCMAGSNPFTKLTFAQGVGTTNCGGAGVIQHCTFGEPGTDGKGSCTSDMDCVGTCDMGSCSNGVGACTKNSDCVGTGSCKGGTGPVAPFSGSFGVGPNPGDKIAGLGLSCLYLGGGNGNATPPSKNPDGSILDLAAICCANDPNAVHLLATGTDPKTCTKGAGPGKHCVNLSKEGQACTTDADCAAGPGSCALDANCFFGPPLPIPSGPLSTCVLNVIQTDSFGQLAVNDGSATITYPLSSRVFLTGNSMEPCPVCQATGVPCSNGHCGADFNQMTGVGPGKACTVDADCDNTCDQGANEGQSCTAVGSEGTTHDCPPNPANPSAPSDAYVGAIPVSLSGVTTGTSTATADASGNFCTPQGVKGAFGNVYAKFISESGMPAGPFTDYTPHSTVLGSTFCVPASGNAAIDGAAGLPGPGATSLPGNITLAP
ncbi:MAG TPA: hypothetical protein VKW76_09460 [Candidatus Binatia bacterium]|nr:hypothetical protein [Candidatus Binatia bacterium]